MNEWHPNQIIHKMAIEFKKRVLVIIVPKVASSYLLITNALSIIALGKVEPKGFTAPLSTAFISA